ncbi:hypothetical protein NMY22_g18030 [Coprinellus aureogranulatus]|nr:hypothetical protein NMY22_g18030 [Coprinellus aureogranulatus]
MLTTVLGLKDALEIRDALPIDFDALDARTIIEDLDVEERDFALDDLMESREFIEALVEYRDFNDFIDSLDARDFDFDAEIPLEAREPRRGGGGGVGTLPTSSSYVPLGIRILSFLALGRRLYHQLCTDVGLRPRATAHAFLDAIEGMRRSFAQILLSSSE